MLHLVLSVLALTGSLPILQSPCDAAPLVNPTISVTGPIYVGICQPTVDADGNPTTVTSFRVTIDGGTVFNGPLPMLVNANAAGYAYYETPKSITVSRGSHVAVVYSSNADGENTGSDPYPFTIKKSPPKKGRVQVIGK